METGYERVRAHDGGEFDAFCARPAGRAPGIVLFQEIFGVNDNMRGLAIRLAEAGHLAIVPDMFWRIQPRFERKDESGLTDGMAMLQKLDWGLAERDMTSVLAHVRGMSSCTGAVGAVGFCLGGSLAYLFAAGARVEGRGPDAAVAYYGSGIHQMLDRADSIDCPMLFHYGAQDPYIPADQIDAVEAAVGERFVVHRYPAGHAFSNWDAPSMYDEAAANLAWDRTLAFFAEHLRS
ncbi:dienelactone hydrolase family protein [Pseudonocardia nigra]|uniref:dienelactone hydrolase family protein n=1 Tax=Pseudonocardia nigra TaxID=1921578 RepID=UPI001C5F0600|nr:dienelactone hydrolase family protein [Pseudonocardia nigra]